MSLSAEHQQQIKDLLHQYLPNVEVWIYGSRAKGSSKPSSDLDMVVFATPQSYAAVQELREAFEESYLPFRVDLFVWDQIPASFKPQIEREKVVF
ncbi:MAG: nucleotidyltransferase domain-containing protein [Fibrobacter sp.]|nr:nucleotidyltransferase domain-containing protein [Fibrobacter sp.]